MTDTACSIRAATQQDAALLASLGERAFTETFAKDNNPEDLVAYLSQSFSLEKQTEELALPGSCFLILEIDGAPAGFARLQDYASDSRLSESPRWSGHPMELVRFYLLQAWTGRRLGDGLMQACLDQARAQGVDVLWLGVWEHNPRAIAFYQRWGFEKAGTHHFQLGQDLQTDWVMARRMLK